MKWLKRTFCTMIMDYLQKILCSVAWDQRVNDRTWKGCAVQTGMVCDIPDVGVYSEKEAHLAAEAPTNR